MTSEIVAICVREPLRNGGIISPYRLLALREALQVPKTATLSVWDRCGNWAALGPGAEQVRTNETAPPSHLARHHNRCDARAGWVGRADQVCTEVRHPVDPIEIRDLRDWVADRPWRNDGE